MRGRPAAHMVLLYSIALVGVLVFVHELGHFACAKFFGVRVLTVSLGFGPRVVGLRLGETDYILSALPIGGYVKMLGDTPHDEVPESLRDQSFDGQPIHRRIMIALAGPMMNLLLPLLVFFVISTDETLEPPPVIGIVYPGQPADGVLLAGDVVRAVDDVPVTTFGEMTRIVQASEGRELRFELERGGETIERVLLPVRARRERELERVDYVYQIGVLPHHPVGVVGVQSTEGSAAAAGLRTFDRVVAARGRPIERFEDLEGALDTRSLVPIAYLRPARVEGALGGLVELDLYEPHVATVAPTSGRGSGLLRAGVESADLYVSHVRVGSPEHRAGILPGDRLVMLDGEPIRLWLAFIDALEQGGDREHTLVYRRGEALLTARYHVQRRHVEAGERVSGIDVGIRHWVPMRLDAPVETPSPTMHALRSAVRDTREMISLTAYSFLRLVQGRLTVRAIGGPLSIFEAAGGAAREGLITYFTLLAFLSVNLGLVNLLPVPLLDGGHVLFFLIEGVTRRPVSTRVREHASMVGLGVLVLLLFVALVNDIQRRWPEISAALGIA